MQALRFESIQVDYINKIICKVATALPARVYLFEFDYLRVSTGPRRRYFVSTCVSHRAPFAEFKANFVLNIFVNEAFLFIRFHWDLSSMTAIAIVCLF